MPSCLANLLFCQGIRTSGEIRRGERRDPPLSPFLLSAPGWAIAYTAKNPPPLLLPFSLPPSLLLCVLNNAFGITRGFFPEKGKGKQLASPSSFSFLPPFFLPSDGRKEGPGYFLPPPALYPSSSPSHKRGNSYEEKKIERGKGTRTICTTG